MGVYLVHHPLHNFSPEVGGGRLHGNGCLQGTLQYYNYKKSIISIKNTCPFPFLHLNSSHQPETDK